MRLLPGDRAGEYRTEPHPYLPGAVMLAHAPDGRCIYLGEGGCTIHDRAPSLCRSADCRALALRLSLQEAGALHRRGQLDIRVWDQGHRLLERARGGGR